MGSVGAAFHFHVVVVIIIIVVVVVIIIIVVVHLFPICMVSNCIHSCHRTKDLSFLDAHVMAEYGARASCVFQKASVSSKMAAWKKKVFKKDGDFSSSK